MSHPVHWTFDADNDQWVRDDGVVIRVGTIPSDRLLSPLLRKL